MAALLGALLGTRGFDEALSFAGVLTFAVILRALAGALALACVSADALGRSGRGSAGTCGSLLRHRGGRQKKCGDR